MYELLSLRSRLRPARLISEAVNSLRRASSVESKAKGWIPSRKTKAYMVSLRNPPDVLRTVALVMHRLSDNN